MPRSRAQLWRSLAVALMAFGLSVMAVPVARADDGQLATYDVAGVVSADGSLSIRATMTFNGAAPASVQQVIDTTRRTPEYTEYRYAISDVSATAGGQPIDVKVSNAPASTTIQLATAGVSAPITLSYRVLGAATANPAGGTLLIWPLLQGLSVPVQVFTAEVEVPAQFNQLDCAAGPAAQPAACTSYAGGTHDAPNPVIRQENVGAGDVVVITLGFPAGQVAVNENLRQLWTLERAFSVAPLPLALGAAVLVLGLLGLWLAQRKIGRDYAGQVEPMMVADFRPIGAGQSEFSVEDGARPGAIGTLIDEHVDPVDVTGAILDLAVRGHLLITELPKESAFAPADWAFTRRFNEAPLADYERTLLGALAPMQGDPVKLSNLPGTLHSVIGDVQSELYDEVVAQGWFAHRPDAVRGRWNVAGWVALVIATLAAAGLIVFTGFGLLGLALILIGLGVMIIAREMPARTAKGTAVLRGLDVLRGNLLTHPVANLSGPNAYHAISELLPFAVVLGGRDRWLAALAAADTDNLPDEEDLDWYHGPQGWHLADLPASLTNFITTVQGTLFSR